MLCYLWQQARGGLDSPADPNWAHRLQACGPSGAQQQRDAPTGVGRRHRCAIHQLPADSATRIVRRVRAFSFKPDYQNNIIFHDTDGIFRNGTYTYTRIYTPAPTLHYTIPYHSTPLSHPHPHQNPPTHPHTHTPTVEPAAPVSLRESSWARW